jgi:hypothetical protein
MSKSVEDGGYVVVTDDGECSSVLENVKDIQEFVECNRWNETEMTIYKLVPCEFTVEKKLVVKERK